MKLTLRSGLLGVRETAVGVVAGGTGVAGAITFTSRLDPDNRIDQAGTSVCCGAGTEAGLVNIAPITPLLTDVLDTRATLIDDEVGREALLCQKRGKRIDVVDLIVVRVTLGDGVGGGGREGVVVGDVCVKCELNCTTIHGKTEYSLVARPRMKGDLPA